MIGCNGEREKVLRWTLCRDLQQAFDFVTLITVVIFAMGSFVPREREFINIIIYHHHHHFLYLNIKIFMYLIDHVAELRFVNRLIYVIKRIYTHRFESRSSRHVGTLGKSFTHSCLWRFGAKLEPTPYLCCVGSASV